MQNKTKTRNEVVKLGNKVGVTIEEDGFGGINLDAPDGFDFEASSANCYCTFWNEGESKGEVWQECYNAIKMGLVEK